MRPLRLIIPCLVVSACFPELALDPARSPGGDEGGESGPTGTGSIELELSAAEPFHGSNMGGLETYIEGGPFDQTVQVWFGDEPADVLAVTESELRVQVPAFDDSGPVTIRASTDSGEGIAKLGFRYWDDQTGETVISGALLQWDWVGADYLDSEGVPVFEDRYAYGQLVQTIPDEWTFLEYLGPGIDRCGDGDEPGGIVSMPEEAFIAGSGVDLELVRWPDEFDERPNMDSLYYYSVEQEPDLADQDFDLEIPAGEYPDLVLEDGLSMNDGLKVVQPVIELENIWESLDAFELDSDYVRWSGAEGDYVYLYIRDGLGSGQNFGCVVENTGSFKLDSDSFSSFTGEEYEEWFSHGVRYLAYIRVIDLNVRETQLDFNNANATMLGGTGVLGLAYFLDED